jgi:hypothetical protein
LATAGLRACGVSSHGVARVAVHGSLMGTTADSDDRGKTHLATATATAAAVRLRYVVTREYRERAGKPRS